MLAVMELDRRGLRPRAPLARRAVRRPLLHRRHDAPASTAGRSARRARRRTRTSRYFPTAAAAEAAGFRPCLRCRPEASPGTPAWLGTSGVVSRALRLIGEGALDGAGVDDALGATARRRRARHLRRLFLQHLGATPLDVALTRRVHFAKKLLDETSLAVQPGRVRVGLRQRPPLQRSDSAHLRADADRAAAAGASAWTPGADVLPLPARVPTAVRLGGDARVPAPRAPPPASNRRARPAIGARSRSTARTGTIDVSPPARRRRSSLDVRFRDPRALLSIVERVRRMFDLGADPAVIAEHLRGDPSAGAARRGHPGIRVPGAWDGFELAVRAILGQQISVRAATTIAGRLAERSGLRSTDGGARPAVSDAAQLADAPLEGAGVMPARAATIRSLARAVRTAAWCSTGWRRSPRCARFPASATGPRSTSRCARSASPTRFRGRSRAAARGRRLHRARARASLRRVAAVARLRRDAALAGGDGS